MTWKRPPPLTREQRLCDRAVRMAAMAASVQPRDDVTMAGESSGETITKEGASQHSGYMAAVRKLGYCMRCQKTCKPQFCHRDQGKGIGIKTDARLGWPGCGDCHHLVGSSGKLGKQGRREEEDRLGAQTRREIEARGWWPPKLQRWPA